MPFAICHLPFWQSPLKIKTKRRQEEQEQRSTINSQQSTVKRSTNRRFPRHEFRMTECCLGFGYGTACGVRSPVTGHCSLSLSVVITSKFRVYEVIILKSIPITIPRYRVKVNDQRRFPHLHLPHSAFSSHCKCVACCTLRVAFIFLFHSHPKPAPLLLLLLILDRLGIWLMYRE